jgi:hypothetical protein
VQAYVFMNVSIPDCGGVAASSPTVDSGARVHVETIRVQVCGRCQRHLQRLQGHTGQTKKVKSLTHDILCYFHSMCVNICKLPTYPSHVSLRHSLLYVRVSIGEIALRCGGGRVEMCVYIVCKINCIIGTCNSLRYIQIQAETAGR